MFVVSQSTNTDGQQGRSTIKMESLTVVSTVKKEDLQKRLGQTGRWSATLSWPGLFSTNLKHNKTDFIHSHKPFKSTF